MFLVTDWPVPECMVLSLLFICAHSKMVFLIRHRGSHTRPTSLDEMDCVAEIATRIQEVLFSLNNQMSLIK